MIEPSTPLPDEEFDVHLTVPAKPDLFRPYPHQQAAWNAMTAHFLDKKKQAGLVVVPTGGGKTVIASRWLLQNHIREGGRVLWLTHRRSLLMQAFDTFVRDTHLAAPLPTLGLIRISQHDARWTEVAEDHHVVFSSIQSAALERSTGSINLLIQESPHGLFIVVDEAHHAAAPSYLRLLKQFKAAQARVIGLTATPTRMDDADNNRLWDIFDRTKIYEINKRELILQEILAQPHVETVQTRIDMERDFTAADYEYLEHFGELAPKVLDQLAKHAARNKLIVDYYRSNAAKFGKTIVFAATALHARTLAEEFLKASIKADYVDYTRGDSSDVMDRFRDNPDPVVLANVEMCTEGFDAPRTKTVFIARPTRSEALLAQMVGRALRGPKFGGNHEAFLVTFVDTWKEFSVLDTEVVVAEDEAHDPDTVRYVSPPLLRISDQLVVEAYKLVQSVMKGTFEGFHACLPHAWYVWEEETEEDLNRRLVLVFENQTGGYQQLLEEKGSPSQLPSEITFDFAHTLRRQFFATCPDPWPTVPDLAALLKAYKNGLEVHYYTFDEKREFDPDLLAVDLRQYNPDDRNAQLREIFEAKRVCQLVYRSDFESFREDVAAAIERLVSGTPQARAGDSIVEALAVSLHSLRDWPPNESGYELMKIFDTVTAQKRHFPQGVPSVSHLQYSPKPLRSLWGFCRFSDRSIVLSSVLNSSDVPLLVVEFMLYHELLHAAMPNSGRNKDFRQQERRFSPSLEAIKDAETHNLTIPVGQYSWTALADRFLDRFHKRFSIPSHTIRMYY